MCLQFVPVWKIWRKEVISAGDIAIFMKRQAA